MTAKNDFDVGDASARTYQRISVPTMLEPLARATAAQINIPDSANVIDIACGTGGVSRVVAEKMTGLGQITGTDINAAMISIAEELQPQSSHVFDWVCADVSQLPFESESFDMAFIQQGLQFFPDKASALSEVARVLKPCGQIVLTCWSEISHLNMAMAEALHAHIGEEPARRARASFSFRDGSVINGMLAKAGFDIYRQEVISLNRVFSDVREQVMAMPSRQDIISTGEEKSALILQDIEERLARYRCDGVYTIPQFTHLFCAKRS